MLAPEFYCVYGSMLVDRAGSDCSILYFPIIDVAVIFFLATGSSCSVSSATSLPGLAHFVTKAEMTIMSKYTIINKYLSYPLNIIVEVALIILGPCSNSLSYLYKAVFTKYSFLISITATVDTKLVFLFPPAEIFWLK